MDIATRVPPSELAKNPEKVKEHLVKACEERNDMSQIEYLRWEECTRFLMIVLTERTQLEERFCKEFSEEITTERSPVQWAAERLNQIRELKLREVPKSLLELLSTTHALGLILELSPRVSRRTAVLSWQH